MNQPFRYPFEDHSGMVLHDFQRDSVQRAEALAITHKRPRLCLYYKTGAGKTLTSLACIRVMGRQQVLVVAPPTTHDLWRTTGDAIGITVDTVSHAKFRQAGYKLSRTEALIVDEFHLLGGYRAMGFKKLERLSLSLDAPLVIASATPNYNDVERCYCIQRITDPRATEGGYLTFIYRHCATEVNPFGHVPRVKEFLHYPDAASFLADLKNVEYIEDDLVYDIEDVPMMLEVPQPLLTLGYDRRRQRMLASAIERKHTLVDHMLVGDDGLLVEPVGDFLADAIQQAPTPVLVFAVHVGVAKAAQKTLTQRGFTATVVSGDTSKPMKQTAIEAFRTDQLDVLVGTQTLATGTDGLDKMCDLLVILDDTDDNAMRRQLIGRIMPRGSSTATAVAHSNRVLRLVPEPSPGP